MRPYAFDVRCQGASHIKQSKPCQDFSYHYQDEHCTVAIVCDGHGGPDYVRSATGAEYAAKAAMKYIRNFVENVDVSRLQKDDEREGLFTKLKTRIVHEWRAEVKRHCAENPFTETEKAGLSEKARKRYFEKGREEVAYGSTLLVAVYTPRYWFGLHIGDGRCVYLDMRGQFHEIPLDERCFLNATTSICDTDAPAHFHHVFEEELPAAVFVGCDGVDGSFGSSEKFHNFYTTILYSFASEKPDDAVAELGDYLPKLSKRGSGDDISIAAVLNIDALKTLDLIREYDPKKAKEEKEENERLEAERNALERAYMTKTAALRNEMRGLQEQLEKKERKLAQIDGDLAEQKRRIDGLSTRRTREGEEQQDLNKQLTAMQKRLREIGEYLTSSQGKLEQAKRQRESLQSERDAMRSEWEKIKQELEKKARELKQVVEDERERREREQTGQSAPGGQTPRTVPGASGGPSKPSAPTGPNKPSASGGADVEDIQKKKAEVQRGKEELARKEEELARKEERLNKKEAAVNQQKEELDQKKADIEGKASELAQKEEEMNARKAQAEQPPMVWPPYPAPIWPPVAQWSPVYPQGPAPTPTAQPGAVQAPYGQPDAATPVQPAAPTPSAQPGAVQAPYGQPDAAPTVQQPAAPTPSAQPGDASVQFDPQRLQESVSHYRKERQNINEKVIQIDSDMESLRAQIEAESDEQRKTTLLQELSAADKEALKYKAQLAETDKILDALYRQQTQLQSSGA